MLYDSPIKSCNLVINALDECKTGLLQLLHFIVQSASISAYIKWIVLSRNRYEIEQQLYLNNLKRRLNLKLNARYIAQAINMYIVYKVAYLISLKDNKSLQDQV